jgi:hypothetical protein
MLGIYRCLLQEVLKVGDEPISPPTSAQAEMVAISIS